MAQAIGELTDAARRQPVGQSVGQSVAQTPVVGDHFEWLATGPPPMNCPNLAAVWYNLP